MTSVLCRALRLISIFGLIAMVTDVPIAAQTSDVPPTYALINARIDQ